MSKKGNKMSKKVSKKAKKVSKKIKFNTEKFDKAIDEVQRQCSLMLDMADQNISELDELKDSPEMERSVKDLQADFKAASKVINGIKDLVIGYCSMLAEDVWSDWDVDGYLADLKQVTGLDIKVELEKLDD